MSKPALTPIRILGLRLAIGAILIAASVAKLLVPSTFVAALEAADWLPERLAHLLIVAVPAAEFAVGIGLLLGWKLRMAAIGSLMLIIAFTVFLGIETWRGHGDCGCFGEPGHLLLAVTTGVGALIRNGILLLMASALSFGARLPDRWSADYLFRSSDR